MYCFVVFNIFFFFSYTWYTALYWFQVYNTVIRCLHTLQSGCHLGKSDTILRHTQLLHYWLYSPRSRWNACDYFVTAHCTSYSPPAFHPSPQHPSHLATIKMLSGSVSWFLFCLSCFCSCVLDSTCKGICLSDFTQHNPPQPDRAAADGKISLVLRPGLFHGTYAPLLHAFIYWWTLRSLPHLGFCK